MKLEEARLRAHCRGVEMRPDDPRVSVDDMFDQVDVADIIHECLDEIHPHSEAPSRRYNGVAYEQWIAEQEHLRLVIFEAFDAGTRGKPFKVLEPAPAMH